MGLSCESKCPFPSYGLGCQSHCNCIDKDCDPANGCRHSSRGTYASNYSILVCNLLLIYNFMWNVVDITSSEDPNTSLIGLDYKIVSTEVLNPKFQTSERKDDFNQTSMRTSIPVLTYPCRLYSYWREFRRFSRFTLILQQLFNS